MLRSDTYINTFDGPNPWGHRCPSQRSRSFSRLDFNPDESGFTFFGRVFHSHQVIFVCNVLILQKCPITYVHISTEQTCQMMEQAGNIRLATSRMAALSAHSLGARPHFQSLLINELLLYEHTRKTKTKLYP